jgi:hypothetical protein
LAITYPFQALCKAPMSDFQNEMSLTYADYHFL